MKQNTVLTLDGIRKIYGKGKNTYQALTDINLTIRKGEFVGIMGASGAGKSTLLHLIATLDKPTSGTITIAGADIARFNENELADFRRSKLGFVFQDYNLIPSLTAAENIALPLVLAKENPQQLQQRVGQIAALLEIDKILDQYPSTLSGGQKQRVSAARALASNPELMLADEPTGALDSKSGRELLQCFRRIQRQQNATIVMVTHDCFSASYCDRVLFMQDGRLVSAVNRAERSDQEFLECLSEQSLLIETGATKLAEVFAS